MRKIDLGVDLTVPIFKVTNNEGTPKEVDVFHLYAPQPIANVVATDVPDGSLIYDTTANALNVAEAGAWGLV